ncbi:helix-turn-helix transcriptional regulator [Sodaliphilus sp.]|uniref:helix-turn-helix transcriptional regulator n=1 Tax=Sodaliphilus sp. TaxID=2815818 RepID=UPI00388F9F54
MYDNFLLHVRSMCYGGMVAYFVFTIMRLVRHYRTYDSATARFAVVSSSLAMALLAIKNAARFVFDVMHIAFPRIEDMPVFHSPLIMEMMAIPFMGVALSALSRLTPPKGTELFVQLPLLVSLIFFSITGNELVMNMSFTYVAIYSVAVILSVHINVRRYQTKLNETYANTDKRGITWVLITLYIMVGLLILWGIMQFAMPGLLSDCIYFPLSLIPWIFYSRRLLKQDFNIAAMQVQDDENDLAGDSEAALKTWQNAQFGEAVMKFCTDEKNFTNTDLNIVEVARAVGTNRTYVSRWCKEQGMDFSTYIAHIRLDHALPLLVSGYPINEIVTMSGFSSPRSFRTAFVARYNCTPSEYRTRKQA